MKEFIVRARVYEYHKQRITELSRATGLSEAAVVRKLIENSRLEMLPTPASVLYVNDEAATPTDEES